MNKEQDQAAKAQKSSEKAERLAAQLRANLRRRKSQARDLDKNEADTTQSGE